MKNAIRKIRLLFSNGILKNASWLSSERFLRLLINLILVAWVARYLKPENYGILSYAQSLLPIFFSLASLGAEQLVVRELINNAGEKNKVLGSTFVIRIFLGILSILMLNAFNYLVNRNEPDVFYSVLLVSLSVLAPAFDVISAYYLSALKSKRTVIAKTFSFIIVAGFKVYFIVNEYSLLHFAALVSLEYMLNSLFLIIAYSRTRSVKNWQYDQTFSLNLLRDGKFLIFSNVLTFLFIRIDQILIKEFCDNYSLGIYSAAAKLAEVATVLPAAIVTSFYPSVVQSYKEGSEKLKELMKKVYNIIFYVCFSIGIVVTIFSQWIIIIIFGHEYADSSMILNILIWSLLFSYLSVGINQYLVVINRIDISFYRILIGLIFNIVLNYFFIQLMGIKGAAIATILAHLISILCVLLFKSSRNQFSIIAKSLNPGLFVTTFKRILDRQ